MYSQTQRNRPRHNAQSPQHLLPQAFPTSHSSAYNSAQVDTWESPTVTARPRLHSAANSQPHLSGPTSASYSYNAPIAFPEPQLYRSASERPVPPALRPSNILSHSHSTHNLRPTGLHRDPSIASVSSVASSYYHPDEDHEVRPQRTFLMPELISTPRSILRMRLGKSRMTLIA